MIDVIQLVCYDSNKFATDFDYIYVACQTLNLFKKTKMNFQLVRNSYKFIYMDILLQKLSVLSGAGHISAQKAKAHAYEQYEIYDENRKKLEANAVDLLIEETEQIKDDMGSKPKKEKTP